MALVIHGAPKGAKLLIKEEQMDYKNSGVDIEAGYKSV